MRSCRGFDFFSSFEWILHLTQPETNEVSLLSFQYGPVQVPSAVLEFFVPKQNG